MEGPYNVRQRAREEWSVFVWGISDTWQVSEIRNYCKKFGFVSDVYVPRFQSNVSGRKFGFVRFLRWDDANKAIYELDGKVWMGRSLEVSFSKRDKRSRRDDCRLFPGYKVRAPVCRKEPRWEDKGGVGVFSASSNSKQPVRGEANPKMVEWLQRSLVCIESRDVGREKIDRLLKRDIPFVVKVKLFGCRVFPSYVRFFRTPYASLGRFSRLSS